MKNLSKCQTFVKLYVPLVNLSINDNIKFLKNINQVLNKTISSSKYRSEATAQVKSNNLNYLIDSTTKGV